MAGKGFSATLNLKPLRKGEYRLMQAMVTHYGLEGPGELFAVLLRLGYETMHEMEGRGQLKLLDAIATYRDESPSIDHQYTLPARQSR